MLPVLIQLSNYYFVFLLAPTVLATLYPPVGWLSLATAALSAMLAAWAGVSAFPDDSFALQSVVVAAYGFCILALMMPRLRNAPARAAVLQRDTTADADTPTALDQAS